MFVPRHPVVENQFCQYQDTSETAGIGGVLAYAGSVCYLVDGAANQDAIVAAYTGTAPAASGGQRDPFGFLMQKVKMGYHNVHPVAFMMPGDLGSSDVIAQPTYDTAGTINGTKPAPCGVAHLGVWDTVHYTVDTKGTDAMKPGELLYVANSGSAKVTNGTALTNVTSQVAKVVKGASAAQVEANIDNTTLYPIRIKLVI